MQNIKSTIVTLNRKTTDPCFVESKSKAKKVIIVQAVASMSQ